MPEQPKKPRRVTEIPGMFVQGKNAIEAAKALEAYTGVKPQSARYKSTRGSRDRYADVDTNTSVRNSFVRSDYETFRLEETLPKKQREIISFCMAAYNKVGLIRNVIDLMGDFTCQGIRITHPNPRIQKFLRGWWKKVRGRDRSERLANLLYRTGNVVTKRSMMKINVRDEQQYRSQGAETPVNPTHIPLVPDMDKELPLRPASKTLPGRYDFISPLIVEVLGEELAMFAGQLVYAIKISHKLKQKIQYPLDEVERQLVANLPPDLVAAVKNGQDMYILPQEKIIVNHYKKDDWSAWAYPMTYAILDDLILLEKMKLADLAALDGAISQVRLWRLGSLDLELFPTDAAINKLAEILLSNTGGGAFDLIWGPELDLVETSTDVHNFLGPDKYQAVMTGIYAGLGIPPTLTGATSATGFTNNFISLQTLIQRLEYVRSIIKEFWEHELSLVQKAMGFRFRGEIAFDRMTLSDEAAEKALLIQLVDRNIVSYETVRERFGEIPELERLRLNREVRSRKKEEMLDQASPYHTGEKMFELLKIALQKGMITPGEAGMTDVLEKRRPGEKTMEEQMIKMKQQQGGPTSGPKKPTGRSGQGRPKNSRDSTKRKAKTVKPRKSVKGSELEDVLDQLENTEAFFHTMAWACDAIEQIAKVVNPGMLRHYGKPNMRSLTAAESAAVETLKFSILCNIDPFTSITPAVVQTATANAKLPQAFSTLYERVMASANKGDVTVEDQRRVKCAIYALLSE